MNQLTVDHLSDLSNIFGGNATFTVVYGGERYTYCLYTPKTGKNKGKMMAELLTGPINTASYSELGTVDPTTGVMTITGKIGRGEVPNSLALIRWLCVLAATTKAIPANMEVIGAGRCLICGKTLTVPYPDNPYRQMSIGPICGDGGSD